MNRRFRTVRQAWVGGAILALPLLLTAPAAGQCQYEVTAIIDSPPCPFGLHSPVTATGMNNHGAVTGYYMDCLNTDRYGFYWSEKTSLITLPTPDWVIWVLPRDVNDHGVICGSMTMNGVSYLGFTYDINTHPGKYTLLPPTGGGTSSWANAINNNGVVAGARSIGPSGVNPYNAVIWDTATGEVTDLGVMNGPNSEARDINSGTGTSVGWTGESTTSGTPRGFVRTIDGNVVLVESPRFISSSAHAVNEHDAAAGGVKLSADLFDSRAFLWMKDSLLLIDPLPGFIGSGSGHINSLGQMLILNTMGNPNIVTALWQHGQLTQLSTLIVPGSGVTIFTPSAINDFGEILTRGNSGGSNVGVLLAPMNRPPTDLDANCRTDVHDLIMLLNSWGECPPVKPGGVDFCTADFNGDGVVNVFDLLILLGNWD